MKYLQIREEELKNKVAQDYFSAFDCTKIIGNIDFCVANPIPLPELHSLFWAEAKKGKADLYTAITQLVLTIGKARTFDTYLPPAFVGAFDAEKIAFIPYNNVNDIFYINDFNWNVAPSKHDTKEFQIIMAKVKHTIDTHSLLFYFDADDTEIATFIQTNLTNNNTQTSKIQIDKNNFIAIYSKWLTSVKPSIAVNWEIAKRNGLIDGDFYLADLLSKDNETIKDKLYVLLKKDFYHLDRRIDEMGMFISRTTAFLDHQKAHTQFWNKYERPPKEIYWDYIVERRDLLVPQDVRERKGSFFTPQIWVELSQRYLADVLGEDWQDEYYIWDCAAGTGNLLAGLTNKYNIWASTIDQQDVDVMHDRIKNGANLLDSHVFQFDFLNDDFKKLPASLQDIINDPQERRKLIIYINPPYAETAKYGQSKEGVSSTKIRQQYKDKMSFAVNELFSQFFIRIHEELPNVLLASFGKVKYITASNFTKFRTHFRATFKKGFICRANTFDNVKGHFPIAFIIWDLSNKQDIESVTCDAYSNQGKIEQQKTFFAVKKGSVISDWLRLYFDKSKIIAYLRFMGPDFQGNTGIFFTNQPKESDLKESRITTITPRNLLQMCMYLSIRHCQSATWLNDRDQFLFPTEHWQTDSEFQNNCLIYALFHGQNKISSQGGINHWIPFTEQEVAAKDKFKSNFMTQFIKGKLKPNGNGTLLEEEKVRTTPLVFSPAAEAVFEAGKALWGYYHTQKNCDINASLYDIREYFQGRNDGGKMNNHSNDEQYNQLMDNLRQTLLLLGEQIAPKIYEYGFLKR
ncbi:MAG: hypothetical protein JNM36_07800 [Chitinophagales bacterium]|nr:hypothetical protein [Chitinophagales bacterium]